MCILPVAFRLFDSWLNSLRTGLPRRRAYFAVLFIELECLQQSKVLVHVPIRG